MRPEEPDLQGAFACGARVGTAGNPSERPMNGMTEALSPALNGPGGCNEGFLRDDAILVVTFISDDPKFEDGGHAAGVVRRRGRGQAGQQGRDRGHRPDPPAARGLRRSRGGG